MNEFISLIIKFLHSNKGFSDAKIRIFFETEDIFGGVLHDNLVRRRLCLLLLSQAWKPAYQPFSFICI